MTTMKQFNYNELKEKLHSVRLPLDRNWGTLINNEFSCIAFLNLENNITRRKIIIRDDLSVEVYLREEARPWIKVEKPRSIEDVNQILYFINKIRL